MNNNRFCFTCLFIKFPVEYSLAYFEFFYFNSLLKHVVSILLCGRGGIRINAPSKLILTNFVFSSFLEQNPSVQLMQLAKTNNLTNSTCQQAENAPNTPLLLNVSQLHRSGSGFYILNSNQWPTITSASVIKSDQALPDSRILQSPTQMDTNHSPLFEQRLSNSTEKTSTENHSNFPEFSGKENINCNSGQ